MIQGGYSKCPFERRIFTLTYHRNVGVWVGPQFFERLRTFMPHAGYQGLDASEYLADLPGYMNEGGSNNGAAWLGKSIDTYHKYCPSAEMIISGLRSA